MQRTHPGVFHFIKETPANMAESRTEDPAQHTTYDDNYPLTHDYSDVSEVL